MLPMVMHFKIRQAGRRGFGFYFPIILVWILAGVLLIAVFPLFLLGALITRRRGPGFALLLVYPVFFSILWHLGGLHIETKNTENEVLIDFT